MQRKKRLKGYLALLILHVLSEKPMHGYALIKRLREETGHEGLSPGVVYPVLKTLLRKGLIGVRSEEKGRRLLRVYYVTEKGLEHLRERKSDVEDALKFTSRIKELRRLGVDKVFRSLEKIFVHIGALDEEKKLEIMRLFASFEEKVNELLGDRNE